MKHRFHLTRLSANMKTGPMPVSTTSSDTCPVRCTLRGNGCYAAAGKLSIHWRAVSDGRRGGDLDQFCEDIKGLPRRQLWRYAQAGDLPGDGSLIDRDALKKIVSANRGRTGFGYTHYDPHIPDNADAIAHANDMGFTINLSAETLQEADEFVNLNIAPVVVLLPSTQTEHLVTPAGVPVMVCPATAGKTNCAQCGICANPNRAAVIGFPGHGPGKAKVDVVVFAGGFTYAPSRPSMALS